VFQSLVFWIVLDRRRDQETSASTPTVDQESASVKWRSAHVEGRFALDAPGHDPDHVRHAFVQLPLFAAQDMLLRSPEGIEKQDRQYGCVTHNQVHEVMPLPKMPPICSAAQA
jgi:hypothetical protein